MKAEVIIDLDCHVDKSNQLAASGPTVSLGKGSLTWMDGQVVGLGKVLRDHGEGHAGVNHGLSWGAAAGLVRGDDADLKNWLPAGDWVKSGTGKLGKGLVITGYVDHIAGILGHYNLIDHILDLGG